MTYTQVGALGDLLCGLMLIPGGERMCRLDSIRDAADME